MFEKKFSQNSRDDEEMNNINKKGKVMDTAICKLRTE